MTRIRNQIKLYTGGVAQWIPRLIHNKVGAGQWWVRVTSKASVVFLSMHCYPPSLLSSGCFQECISA